MGTGYDPFSRGRFTVGVCSFEALDPARNRRFPGEIWYPAAAEHAGQDMGGETQDRFAVPHRTATRVQLAVRNAVPHSGSCPLVIFSHHSGGHRRAATYLCTHLSSHGFVVAALDHSEVTAPELSRQSGETPEQKAVRIKGWIKSRVPDVLFLLNHLLRGAALDLGVNVDSRRIGVVGHSFGGWTALAAPDVDARIGAVVAIAPGGSSRPKPGILPVKLALAWSQDVSTLYLAAENDVSIPLQGIYELFERTPRPKRLVILRRADHLHFIDDVEEEHETVRKIAFTGELAWIPREMRPISELCSGEKAHLLVRGLAVCHLDAALKQKADAREYLASDLARELSNRGVEAIVPQSDRAKLDP